MHAEIDADACEGHGECVLVAPAVFKLTESGDRAIVLGGDIREENRPAVQRAMMLCPVSAIQVIG